MTSGLTAALSNRFKQKVIPARVVDVLGKKVTVKLSVDGTKLTGITYTGPVPVVGQDVIVDYRNANNPTVIVTSENPPAATTLKSLDCSLPEMPSPTIPPIPPLPPLPPIPPFPIPPIPMAPNPISNCVDSSPANGPYGLDWTEHILGGSTGKTETLAWYNCIIRSAGATNVSNLSFTMGYQGYPTYAGGSIPTFHVYAIDTTGKVVVTGDISILDPGAAETIQVPSDVAPYTPISIPFTYGVVVRVEFKPGAATVVAGFKLVLSGGLTVGENGIDQTTRRMQVFQGKWNIGWTWPTISETLNDLAHGVYKYHSTGSFFDSHDILEYEFEIHADSFGQPLIPITAWQGDGYHIDTPKKLWFHISGTITDIDHGNRWMGVNDFTPQIHTGTTWDGVFNPWTMDLAKYGTASLDILWPLGLDGQVDLWVIRDFVLFLRMAPRHELVWDLNVELFWTTSQPGSALIAIEKPKLFNVCPTTV